MVQYLGRSPHDFTYAEDMKDSEQCFVSTVEMVITQLPRLLGRPCSSAFKLGVFREVNGGCTAGMWQQEVELLHCLFSHMTVENV